MRLPRQFNRFWTIALLVAVALGTARYGAARLQRHGYLQWRALHERRDRLSNDIWTLHGESKSKVLEDLRKSYPNWKFVEANGELQSFRDPEEQLAVALYYYRDGTLQKGNIAWLIEPRLAGWVEPVQTGIMVFDKLCYFFVLPFGLIVLPAAIIWRPVRRQGGRVCAVIGLIGVCLWAATLLSGGAFRDPVWIAPAAVLTLLGLLLYRAGRPRAVDLRYCPHCRYDLTGNESGICPECGNPTPATERRQVEQRLQENEDRLQSLEDDGA